jgi:SPP1 gp7 family putative phage head morphogenesis protein
MAQDEFPLLEEVVDRWAKRDVLPWTAFDALADELKARAFTAKRLWDQQALEQTLESLRQALTEGKTVREWQATSWRDLVARFGTRGVDASHYVDTVFRTNTQAAYAGGRYAEMFNADWMEAAPYWMYSAIHDGRTRPEHRALDGRVFLKSDPDARRYLPPISFNCRCQCIEMREFDIRGRLKVGKNGWLRLAVECKSIGSNFPLVAHTVARRNEEAWIDSMVFRRSRNGIPGTTEPVFETVEGINSLYGDSRPVAKSIDQVGVTPRDEPQFGDEVYEKTSQAVNSLAGLVAEGAREWSEPSVQVFMPVLVVPEGTLWVVRYD